MITQKIKCPSCGSEFDISGYLESIKEEFIRKVEEVVKEMKKSN